MDFGLTEIQEITRKTVRDFAEQEVIPQSRAFDESQEFPHAWAKKMGELGLFGVFVPEKYGGAGLDTVCYAITIEELSRGDASAGVIAAVCNGLVCEPLLRYGNEEQKRRFLEPVARGEWMGAYALTEPGSGSDAAATGPWPRLWSCMLGRARRNTRSLHSSSRPTPRASPC